MPIPDYDGETFVCYTDISGFKEMMKRKDRALTSLNQFYTEGYRILQKATNVHGIFVSDCAVLFVNSDSDIPQRLTFLLDVIERLNQAMLRHDVMLTTSIAYGRFKYNNRLEFTGIEKNPIYGNAYVEAFIDNESGQPRIQPGECRLVAQSLDRHNNLQIQRLKHEKKHYYFYWMVPDEDEIPAFTKKYTDIYNNKYRRILDVIKEANRNRV